METNKTEILMNNAIAYIWLALAICCLIGVVMGAWWHLFTAGIALLMYFTMKVEDNKQENEDTKRNRAQRLNNRL